MIRKRAPLVDVSARAPRSGQAMVEFALASMAFLLIVFGTIDFGRAIFMNTQLHNAAREGARYGKIHPSDTADIKAESVDHAGGTGLTASGVTVSSCGTCKTGESITVTTSVQFQAITQELLGIDPLTLTSSSTARIE